MRSLIILIFLSFPLMAIENQYMLRVGVEVVNCFVRSSEDEMNNKVYSAGIAAYYARIFTKYEFGISTHVFVGAIDDFYLSENGEALTGDGTVSSQSYSIFIKRFFEIYPFKYWRFYAMIGPSAIFNTVKLRNFVSTSTQFTHNHKITSDAVGLTFAMGIEENALKKESRPNYFQISYSGHRPTKFTVIDATDFTQIESVYQSSKGRDIIIHTFMIEAGFLLF